MLEPVLELCRATENRHALPLVAACLGSAYLESGREAEAMRLLEEAVETITAMGTPGTGCWIIASLAEAYLDSGRVAEARGLAEQVVARAHTHHQRSFKAWALKLRGDIHAHAPPEGEQAGDAYRQALALATELGMRPLAAHCHFGLGRLYRQTIERDQAREQLTIATTMYREMGMQFWLEQADVAMKELA